MSSRFLFRAEMVRLVFVTGLLCLLADPFAARAGTGEDEGRRLLTLDDVLMIEGIGEAAFSPDGKWLAYNLVPAYETLADYSYWLRAYGLSGHQLWVRDMAGSEPARLQPGLDPDATNFLFGFSPDGSRVVTIEHRLGRHRLVVCRTGRDDCVRFSEMPDIRDRYVAGARYNERLVWTSNDRFVVPVRDPDLPGSEMRSRGTAGRFLWREWNKAWSGEGVTASEAVSTGRDRSEDWASGRLVEFDLSSGTTRLVAEGRFAGVRVSPDRRYLIAARTGERRRPPPDARPVAHETHPVFDRRYGLRLIDLKTGKTDVFNGPFNIDPHSLTWSPDSRRFAVFGWDRQETPQEGCFYIVDTAALRPGCRDHGALVLATNHLDPDYKWWAGPARAALLDEGIAVLARDADEERLDWYLLGPGGTISNLSASLDSPAGQLLHAGDRSITIISGTNVVRLGTERPVDPILPEGIEITGPLTYRPNMAHSWSNEFRLGSPLIRYPLQDTADFIVETPDVEGDGAIVHVNFDGTDNAVALQPVGIAGARVLAASRAAGAMVATLKEGAATRLLLIRGHGRVEELARINEHLNGINHPVDRPVSYTLEDPSGEQPARSMQGCLLLPPGYESGKRYPVLVEVYPTGTGGRCKTLEDAARAGAVLDDLWSARGFIYFRPALPLDLASTPEGSLAGYGNLLDQAIGALVEQGYADPGRIALYGFSQGGIASLVAATQSDRLAAVISVNGWADYFSHYFGARGLMRYFHLDQNGGDNRWRYECAMEGPSHYCPFGFGESALENPAAYARTSPVANAADITAPVLLVHSDFDYFDMAQYDEMFGALYRAGKEARYVRYWGEGHGPSSPDNIRDFWRRIDGFLEESGIFTPDEDTPRARD
ncbi:prolyl oligopeptidase family serine peptidase [Henriciella sp.]|uniref:S9 family peptidase n=1 Tax=Henriciella sp. TaxID=1968823 RepID=UPI002626D0CC|nr:prolyl oligopeptidase family serine peptidase [Henriciella sp.]